MNGKQTTIRLRHAIILAIGLGISQFAFALRLGPINVKSYLGQPMNATIRVDGLNANSAEATQVSIASPAAYRSHGVEMLPIHSQMRFALVPSGKGYVIRVTSTGSVKEPFVNFLVTVTGNGSTVTREYAAFFNPNPTMTAGTSDKPTVIVEKQRPQQQKAVIAERSTPAPARRNQSANTSGWGGNNKATPTPRKPAPAPTSTASSSSGSPNTPDSIPVGSTYGPIKPGETLYSIAKAARPSEDMRIYDMMRLIFRANRHAFIGGDMSNMMAGATLRIPNPAGSSSSNNNSQRATPERRPAPAPKSEPKPRPAPKPVVNNRQENQAETKKTEEMPTITNTPASAAAQLAFGNDSNNIENNNTNNQSVEKSTPIPVVPPPAIPAPEEVPKPAENNSSISNNNELSLDPPESVSQENSNTIPVPPPEPLDIPEPEPQPEVQPEPEPAPAPAPPPAEPKPVVKSVPRPAPVPAPAPQDDSLFGLGLSIPVLGGIVAGILALIGGLIFLLRKRKKKDDDHMEEFTPEEINRMVEEMERENNDLNFDDLAAEQASHSDDTPVSITKLEPEYKPSESSSVDELGDDFFKDLEIPEDDNVFDSSFEQKASADDDFISDASELEDSFFTGLDLSKDKPEEETASFALDDDQDDFLSNFDPNIDDSNDFATDPTSDFFTDNDKTTTSEETTSSDSLFDDLDFITTDDDDMSVSPAPAPATTASDDDDFSMDFFKEDSDHFEPTIESENNSHYHADNSVDYFDDLSDHKEEKHHDAPATTSGVDDDFNHLFDSGSSNDQHDNSDNYFDEPPPPKGIVTSDSKSAPIEDFFDENEDDDAVLSKPISPSLEKTTPPEPSAPPPPVAEKKPAPAPVVDAEAMEINLDMATSFMTMGKSEKARSWLEEVLESGTEEQKIRANEMLAKIDKS